MMIDLQRAMELDALEAEDSEDQPEELYGLRKIHNIEKKDPLWRYTNGPLPTDF